MALTPQQRFDFGRKQRKQMRRADHAGWNPKHRTQQPLKLLQVSVRGRVPSLVDLKNQRMAVSPFAYYRGAVPVMAYDLSLSPNSGITTQLCGDAHVRNLGAYEGLDGRLTFDINDFDETLPGPFEWDVKRMSTSLILAGWDANAKTAQCHEAASIFLDRYRRTIIRLARLSVLDIARYQVHRLRSLPAMSAIFLLAERATPVHNMLALTEPTTRAEKNGKSKPKPKPAIDPTATDSPQEQEPAHSHRIFKSAPPVLTRVTGSAAQSVLDSLTTYTDSLLPERRHFFSQYHPIDVSFKVVGTGSVGLRDYCIYMEGNGAKDPFFLQIKEEATSAYAPYLGAIPGIASHNGQRVVEGERRMQLQSDPFLGWTTITGRDYLVRQLNDHKGSVDITQLRGAGLLEYAAVCGELLARGHARAGDPLMLSGYIGASPRFDDAITQFAIAYANQTEADWKRFVHDTHASTKPAKASSKKASVKITAKASTTTEKKFAASSHIPVAIKKKSKPRPKAKS
jgi:uncharacterized protein (DUF2252 family)